MKHMNRSSTFTLRLDASPKRRSEARARGTRRSLPAQVIHGLQSLISGSPSQSASGRFVGLYQSSRIPTEAEIAEVRQFVWGNLGRTRDTNLLESKIVRTVWD